MTCVRFIVLWRKQQQTGKVQLMFGLGNGYRFWGPVKVVFSTIPSFFRSTFVFVIICICIFVFLYFCICIFVFVFLYLYLQLGVHLRGRMQLPAHLPVHICAAITQQPTIYYALSCVIAKTSWITKWPLYLHGYHWNINQLLSGTCKHLWRWEFLDCSIVHEFTSHECSCSCVSCIWNWVSYYRQLQPHTEYLSCNFWLYFAVLELYLYCIWAVFMLYLSCICIVFVSDGAAITGNLCQWVPLPRTHV